MIHYTEDKFKQLSFTFSDSFVTMSLACEYKKSAKRFKYFNDFINKRVFK